MRDAALAGRYAKYIDALVKRYGKKHP